MKSFFLASAAVVALTHTASAYTISMSSALPPLTSFVTPTASSGSYSSATTDLYAGGKPLAKSPFDGVSGYEGTPYEFVRSGTYATFSQALNPTFVTGGDTFSFVLGSPDAFNTLSFSNGISIAGAFGTSGTGYENVTISGLGSYNSVTFASSENSMEFAAYSVSSVPLPASLPLFGLAILGLGGVAIMRQRRGSRGAVAT